MNKNSEIAVIGAGTMGIGIAHVFAQHGYTVKITDISEKLLEKSFNRIEGNLLRQVKKGLFDENEKDKILKRISLNTSVDESVRAANLVIEAVVEKIEIKKKVLTEVDRTAPKQCIIASNTSSISITDLGRSTSRPDKVIGMHFMNPVPVMQLVEIVKGLATSDDTVSAVEAIAESLHKTPVVVKDYPGFISNRILMPMINEAIYCVMEGVAAPEDIDTVMKLGMNHPMGPLTLADFIGLDVCLSIMEVLQYGFGDDKYRPCPLLRNMVSAGQLGRKSGKGFFQYGE